MNNERKVSSALMKEMSHDLPGSVVIKHSDRATSGIPDITGTWGGYTNWVEDKLLRKGKKLKEILDTDQLIMCHQLAMQSKGRCWVVIYEEQPKQITIWQPRRLMAFMFPRLIFGEMACEPFTIQPHIVDAKEAVNIFYVLETAGAIRCEGWRHRFVTKLIKDVRDA